MSSIAVSILNYQAAQETIECVKSLLKAGEVVNPKCLLDIRVADNSSNVADQQVLQAGLKNLPNVAVHFNPENVGFAAGHNRNIAGIFERSQPDYLWILNNDCQVKDTSLSELIDCATKQPEVGIWGATLLEADGETVQCAGGCFYNHWLSSYKQYGRGINLGQLEKLPMANFDYIAGASMFMPSATLLNGLGPAMGPVDKPQAQWLNETFFLYFEELDLAARLKPGIDISWCRAAYICHKGESGSSSKSGSRSPQGEFHSSLSALKFTHLYHPGKIWLMAPARLAIKSLFNLLTWRFDLIRALFSAYQHFWVWSKNVA